MIAGLSSAPEQYMELWLAIVRILAVNWSEVSPLAGLASNRPLRAATHAFLSAGDSAQQATRVVSEISSKLHSLTTRAAAPTTLLAPWNPIAKGKRSTEPDVSGAPTSPNCSAQSYTSRLEIPFPGFSMLKYLNCRTSAISVRGMQYVPETGTWLSRFIQCDAQLAPTIWQVLLRGNEIGATGLPGVPVAEHTVSFRRHHLRDTQLQRARNNNFDARTRRRDRRYGRCPAFRFAAKTTTPKVQINVSQRMCRSWDSQIMRLTA
jgi:hypothetical protein